MHDRNHSHSSNSNLKLAFFLNLAFTVIEFFGGLFTNSIAIMADALHDLGDSLSLGLSWLLEHLSKKGRSPRFSYGYRRLSLLAALINSLILIVGSVFVLSKAIPRLLNPETSNYGGMLLLAVLGIVVNGIAVLRLKKGKSLNEAVISWHLLEDVLGWAAILIISVVNMFKEIPVLDPAVAIIFTSLVVYNVLKALRKVGIIFLQGMPEDIDIKKIEKELKSIKDVKSVHDIHAWTLDSEHNVLTLHIVVPDRISKEKMQKIKCDARKMVCALNIQHVTIEIEEEHESCDYKVC